MTETLIQCKEKGGSNAGIRRGSGPCLPDIARACTYLLREPARGSPEIESCKTRVVLFCGGRGAASLIAALVTRPTIALTLAINGYDDGASTGAVRRALGNMLGPSDFRKNAVRLARLLRTCPTPVADLLEVRLPAHWGPDELMDCCREIRGRHSRAAPDLQTMFQSAEVPLQHALQIALGRFRAEMHQTNTCFQWGGCCLGNLVFAGLFLGVGCQFNLAVDAFCSLLGLPSHMIQNVTTGTNAWLAALEATPRLLLSEEEIADPPVHTSIDELFVVTRRPPPALARRLRAEPLTAGRAWLTAHAAQLAANPQVVNALLNADMIIYGPGTPHSSLYPSYLTPGIGEAIANNRTARKILITNLHEDAGLHGWSALDLLRHATRYLGRKEILAVDPALLVTDCIVNDRVTEADGRRSIGLGHGHMLSSKTAIHVGQYADRTSYLHDARLTLGAFGVL